MPTTDFESTDYELLAPTESSPSPRYGHAAATIDDEIYIYGGSDSPSSPTPISENGAVHVFDTKTNSWTTLTPASSAHPPNLTFAAAVATTEPHPNSAEVRENDPNPKFSTARQDLLPKSDLEPGLNVPEPAALNTYGSLIIYGGIDASGAPSNAIWTFDIGARLWSQLPSPPLTLAPNPHPNLAIVGNRLYTYAENTTFWLDLDLHSKAFVQSGTTDLGLSPLAPWSSIVPAEGAPSPDGERSGAALIPVSTGQGRNYLLLVGGNETGDIWTLQLKPEGMSVASFRDAASEAVGRHTTEATWAEVRYLDSEGEIVQEGQSGRGVGARIGMGVSKVGEYDGGAFVVWGGVGADGAIIGDGALIDVDV